MKSVFLIQSNSNRRKVILITLRASLMGKEDAFELLKSLSEDPTKLGLFIDNQSIFLQKTGLRVTTEEVQQILDIIAGLKPRDEMAPKLTGSLLNVLDQIENGFKYIQNMYLLAFGVGIGLVGLSVALGIFARENILSIAFGGLGTADIVLYFVYRPAELLQESRAKLAKLVMAFIGWLDDAHDWNAVFLRAIGRADQGGTIQELVAEVSKISDEKIAHVKDTIKTIEDSSAPKTT